MRGKPHSVEVRAQVMAALLAGQGVREVATAYNIDKAIVSRWKNNTKIEALQQKNKGQQLEELLFEYLSTTLRTLETQAEVVGEPDYIRKQPADSLAVLHGVMADKSIRLLEAIDRARKSLPPENGSGIKELSETNGNHSP